MASLVAPSKRKFGAIDGEGVSQLAAASDGQRSTSSSTPVPAPPTFRTNVEPHLLSTGNADGRFKSGSPSPASHGSRSPVAISRTFDPAASIVLIGLRGTGKSTLGVIASTSCHRRLIEADRTFRDITGHSGAAYRKIFGATEHIRQESEVLKSIFRDHGKGCVIVCGSSVMESRCQLLLQEFAKDHPVIYILREAKSVRAYLKIWEEEKIANLLEASGSVFRSCSNFEFYNLTESHAGEPPGDEENRGMARSGQKPQFLALKKPERHFLKFLTLICGKASLPLLDAAYPLSQLPVEARNFTYAGVVPVEMLLSDELDIETIEHGADALELVVNCSSISNQDSTTVQTQQANPSMSSSISLGSISQAFARLRRNTIVPIIYHVNSNRTGSSASPHGDIPGQGQIKDPKYMETVRHGLRLAPEFTTIDLTLPATEIKELLRMRGSTKMIAYFSETEANLHNWDDDLWVRLYEKAVRLGFDAVRFSRPAENINDNLAVQRFREKISSLHLSSLPLIAYNSGRLGRTSACFNPILTPVMHPELQLSIEQDPKLPAISALEATKALYASFVFDPMRFYITGANATYSLSPDLHRIGYKACGMPHTYEIYQTPSLSDLHTLVSDPNFGGSSIALPFKVEIIALMDYLSRHAKAIGAVNTVIPVRRLRPDGTMPDDLGLCHERNQAGPVKKLYGENTDWVGIRACIRRGLSPVNAVRPRTSVLIVGAGGMARAAIYAMLQLGVKNIAIFNRTIGNAEKVVAHFERLLKINPVSEENGNTPLIPTSSDQTVEFRVLKSIADPWPEEFRQPTIVVSGIPTHSIANNPDPNFTLPHQWMKSPTGGVVLELAYKHLHTPMLDQVREQAHKGWVAMDGLDLLPEQGFAQFELFTGRRAPRRLMRAEILRNWRDDNGETDHELIQARLDRLDGQEP